MRNLLKFAIIICCSIFSSCKSQEIFSINYEARTRGYHHKIELVNSTLFTLKNGDKKSMVLSKEQLKQISNLLSEINFKEIENNISIDELALDQAIKGIFTIKLKEKIYKFEFNHQKLPDIIQNLLNQLEEFSK